MPQTRGCSQPNSRLGPLLTTFKMKVKITAVKGLLEEEPGWSYALGYNWNPAKCGSRSNAGTKAVMKLPITLLKYLENSEHIFHMLPNTWSLEPGFNSGSATYCLCKFTSYSSVSVSPFIKWDNSSTYFIGLLWRIYINQTKIVTGALSAG